MTTEELTAFAADASARISHLEKFLKIAEKREELAALESAMTAPDFWDHKEKAQETVAALSACRNLIEPFAKLQKEVEDFSVYPELAAEDDSVLAEAEEAAGSLAKALDQIELLSFLSGKFDSKGLFFTIHAGAGGTESCDWASMLLRMYRRYFERRNWKDEVLDMQPGEEAGIKSATLHVTGDFAYGYMKCEKGVHRLVRISPFDSNARRQTSFASVDAVPELDDDIDIEIDEKDLRIDTYRSSGKGGQGVNTTDSAVRLTHLPTGVVVCCQNERSQHKNKATALRVLKAKLYEMEEEKRRSEANAERIEKSDNGWGNQIRSYVLQPYQMVKDLRTGVETSDTAGVLDGEIQEFIEGFLKAAK